MVNKMAENKKIKKENKNEDEKEHSCCGCKKKSKK